MPLSVTVNFSPLSLMSAAGWACRAPALGDVLVGLVDLAHLEREQRRHESLRVSAPQIRGLDEISAEAALWDLLKP